MIQSLKDIRNWVLNPIRKIRKEKAAKDKIQREQLIRETILKLVPSGFYFSHTGYCTCCESTVTFEAKGFEMFVKLRKVDGLQLNPIVGAGLPIVIM